VAERYAQRLLFLADGKLVREQANAAALDSAEAPREGSGGATAQAREGESE